MREKMKEVQDSSKDVDIFGDAISTTGSKDPDQQSWDLLIQNIIDGKVIPVIGPELLTVERKNENDEVISMNINEFIIKGLAGKLGVKHPHSFSEMIYSDKYKNHFGDREVDRDKIYDLVYQIFAKNRFPATKQLEKFLSIRQFPFVITTSYAPIVEQAMRNVWKDELRVMRFCNNPVQNDDIKTEVDLRKPTVYYMFGKYCEEVKKYALTDTDMLDYVSSWLSNDNKVRPKNLCNALRDKYLLMLGNSHDNWLFRFIWYSVRKSNLGHGMLAYDLPDEQLINFLARVQTFTRQNTSEVMEQIITRLNKKLAEEKETEKFNQPKERMDVFISYSRSDSEIADKLYEALTKLGKRVWYDRNNVTEGGNFMEEIYKAIRTAQYFIPIFSGNITKEKKESHVYRNEWDTAIEVAISMGRTFIIPIAVKDFDFYKAAIPEKLRQYNAIHFAGSEDIEQVAENISRIMNQD